MDSRTRNIVVWALLPVALLLVGVVNYFTGGLSAPEEPIAEQARLDFDSVEPEYTFGSVTVLELRWGDADDQAALSEDGDGVPISTVEAVVPLADGGIMLVDHPSNHVGARVRTFSAAGELVQTALTPGGSTHFTSLGDRLVYVLAKQSDANEQLVVRRGSEETTFAVPLQLNSGSIVGLDGDIWVTATRTAFDATKQEVTATQVMVPVVVDGRQVSDEDAAESARDGWFTVEGLVFTREQLVVGHGESAQVTQKIGMSESAKLVEIPGRSTPLGVDGNDLIYVGLQRQELEPTVRRLPATLGETAPIDEILVGRFDGSVVGRIVAPGAVPTVGGWPRFAVTPQGDLLTTVSDGAGVRIVRYEAVDAE